MSHSLKANIINLSERKAIIANKLAAISKRSENFLKEFSRNFHREIINTDDFIIFENTLNKWITDTCEATKTILVLMEYHEKSEFWFSSIIGFFYQCGIGCDVDKNKALKLYLQAVNNEETSNQKFTNLQKNDNEFKVFQNINNIIGKYLLSLFYYKDIILDERDIDMSDFVINFLKSARKGDPIAQDNLGYCYQYGQGVSLNYGKAFNWYSKSANNGCASGQNHLGYCYQYGQGVAQDFKMALKCYSESASNGYALGQCNLGFCYEKGFGTDKDYGKAFKWYSKSAHNGCDLGQYNLGFCYQYGIGTEVNIKEAAFWYKKASDNGMIRASIELNKISKSSILYGGISYQ